MSRLVGIGIGTQFRRRRGVPALGYTKAQTQSFIDDGYIPVATHQDLDAVRTASVRTFGAGTEWEDTYMGGLDKNYIQVADIDLYDECRTGGAYWNDGAGWLPIGIFTGTYNGGGHIINGLYINRTSSDVGLFSIISSAKLSDIALLNYDVNTTNNNIAGLVGRAVNNLDLQNIIGSGKVSGASYIGGVVGEALGVSIGTAKNMIITSILKNTNFAIGLYSGRGVAEIITKIIASGQIIDAGNFPIHNKSFSGRDSATIISCYFDDTVTDGYNIVEGTPKTTAQMLSGTPSAEIYTDWDTEIDAVTGKPVWVFKEGRYPILSIFGELAANIPAPINLTPSVNGSDVILTWDDHADAPPPVGYNLYFSKDNGAWTKVNNELLTAKTGTHTPVEAGSYNYFVKAVYHIRGFDQETGNSVTTIQVI